MQAEINRILPLFDNFSQLYILAPLSFEFLHFCEKAPTSESIQSLFPRTPPKDVFESLIHPEDQAKVLRYFDYQRQEEHARISRIDYRLKLPNSKAYSDFSSYHLQAQRDASGLFQHLIGVSYNRQRPHTPSGSYIERVNQIDRALQYLKLLWQEQNARISAIPNA